MSEVTGGEPFVVPASVRPVLHPWRWAVGGVVMAGVALFARAFAASPAVHWHVIGHYLFQAEILSGVEETLKIAVFSEAGSIVLGLVLAVFRLSANPVLRAVAAGYVALFRSIPLLVLLIFIYNLSYLFPQLGVGLPFTGVAVSVSTNSLITGFTAAVAGFSLHEGAYMAEIFRAGIQGVDRGQWDAAAAVGAGRGLVLRRIVLPQALRLIIPPAGNNFINLLKATSLVAVISGADLLTQAQTIYSSNFQVIPLLLVATIWYLALVGIASLGQQYLERVSGKDGRSRQRLWRLADESG